MAQLQISRRQIHDLKGHLFTKSQKIQRSIHKNGNQLIQFREVHNHVLSFLYLNRPRQIVSSVLSTLTYILSLNGKVLT